MLLDARTVTNLVERGKDEGVVLGFRMITILIPGRKKIKTNRLMYGHPGDHPRRRQWQLYGGPCDVVRGLVIVGSALLRGSLGHRSRPPALHATKSPSHFRHTAGPSRQAWVAAAPCTIRQRPACNSNPFVLLTNWIPGILWVVGM